MKIEHECAIWRTPARYMEIPEDGFAVDSPRAGGDYVLTGSASALLKHCDDNVRVRLTSWLVEQRRLGNISPRISSNEMESVKNWVDIDVKDRADNVLRYFESGSKTLGAEVRFNLYTDPMFGIQLDSLERTYCEVLAHSGCLNREDLVFLLEYLKKSGLIEYSGANTSPNRCILTVKGYARLAELKKSHVASSRAFVAMWFDGSMDEAWESGFDPAIREAGYEPFRVDQHEHVNKIDDVIIAEIRRSRFVVADFSQGKMGARGGVYYEAGFAHGLDIPVIFTCQERSFDKVHFDTRQYNHIVWGDPNDLREQLSNRIAAVIGDGPNRTTEQ